MTLAFDCVFLDSQPLIESHWPNISQSLAAVGSFAKALNVDLFLPEPVESELEKHALRLYSERCQKLAGDIQYLQGTFPYLEDDSIRLMLPNVDTLQGAMRAATEEAKKKLDLTTIPMTTRPSTEIFQLALDGQPPFERNKRSVTGYQDTIIFLSIVDFLSSVNRPGVLVSRDGIYQRENHRLQEIASASGAQLSFLPLNDLEELLKEELMSRLSDELRQKFDQDLQRATEALDARKQEIKDFLIENLTFSSSMLLFRRIKAVHSLEVGDIGNIDTGFFDRKEGSPARLSFDVAIEASVTAENLAPMNFAIPLLKCGQELIAESDSSEYSSEQLTLSEERIRQTATVGAQATISNGQYEEIRFLSAKLRTFGLSGYLRGA